MKSQADWLNQMRCGACHQIGTKATREIPKSLGTFHSSLEAWERRVKSGQMGPGMAGALAEFGPRGMAMYADWTDRIAAGEVPEAPPRPQGVERNVVVSLWDWSNARRICPRHDFDRQAQSDPQRQRSRLQHFEVQRARCEHPRPGAPYGNGCGGADSRPEHGVHQPAEERWSRHPTGARRSSGRARPACTTPCWIAPGGSGSRMRFVRPPIRRSANRDRAIHPPSSSLSTPAAAISP